MTWTVPRRPPVDGQGHPLIRVSHVPGCLSVLRMVPRPKSISGGGAGGGQISNDLDHGTGVQRFVSQSLPPFIFLEWITMPTKTIKAPSHLTPEAAAWWRIVQTDYNLEAHHVKLLTLACEAFDRAQQQRVFIDADGPVTRTSDGGLKAHPAVAIERDARLAFARLLRELDLDTEPPEERSRPPALRSNRRG